MHTDLLSKINIKNKFIFSTIDKINNNKKKSAEFLYFNWQKYIQTYNDLSYITTKNEAWKHWKTHGKKENREYFLKKKKLLHSELDFNYEQFDWEYYIQYYNDIALINKTKKCAYQHWNDIGKKEGRYLFILNTQEEITVDNFDWVSYICINHDLKNMNKSEAWHHWTNFGKKEYRPYSRINTSTVHNARLGNLFLINMAIHFIALKNNIKIKYKYYDEFKELGVNFFIGKKTYKEDFVLTDNSFLNIINKNEPIKKNLIIENKISCQTREFCFFLKEQLKTIFTENIKNKNIFNERYNNNNDLFIHVRLGDVQDILQLHNSFKYYDQMLSIMFYEKAYISSDSIHNELCKKLIKKYNLNIINYNDVETIMFASTCNNIVLSGGTFSWLIGFFAFYSEKIYYPDNTKTWYGDIFVFPEWIKVKII